MVVYILVMRWARERRDTNLGRSNRGVDVGVSNKGEGHRHDAHAHGRLARLPEVGAHHRHTHNLYKTRLIRVHGPEFMVQG